jgi:hypothetical protein
MKQKTVLEYIWDKLLLDDDHWGWRGEKDRFTDRAMARVRIDGKRVRTPAARMVYELMRGPIPPGLTLAHQCGDVTCARPDHMEPKSQQANLMESETALASINARKTHCVNGHEFTPENTGRSHRGARRCRACDAERIRRLWREHPEEARQKQRDYRSRRDNSS